MKKSIIFGMLALFFTASFAQIDRSQQPKPGPTPKINLKDAEQFKLKNGLTVMVVENHKLPRVSIQLIIDNPPILEGEKAGVASLTGSMLGKGSKNISKDDFYEEVDYLGANINFGSQSAFASGLSKYFPRLMELMADAAINPNFLEEEFTKEQEILIQGIKTGEKSVTTAARRVEDLLTFGADHPYGEYTSEETVNNVALGDVAQFYNNYFRPNNAYLAIVGDVRMKDVKKLVKKHFKKWEKGDIPSPNFGKPQNIASTEIAFVNMDNAVQSEISMQRTIDLQKKDKDYFSALVANQILGGDFNSYLNMNLREDKGYTYGARSILSDDKYAARFGTRVSVRNAVTDSSVVETLKEIDRIINEPVDDERLKNIKAKYLGNFILALERPQTIARYALNIETEDLPEDFYKNYLSNIEKVTKEDVQNAAKKYFSAGNARMVVTGKGAEVLENLQKVEYNGQKLPIKYYDKYGSPTAKPEFNKELPADLTVQNVLDNYIKAIGGKDKLSDVESVLIKAEAAMQGITLNLELKKTSKEQLMQDIKMMGNSMNKQVLDGNKGYVVARGQKKDLEGDDLKKVKLEAAPFPEMNWDAGKLALEKIEAVDGKDAYVIKVSDEKSIYYAVDSGLKLKEVKKVEANGQSLESSTNYGDYQEVAGIKFPFMISQNMGPQKVDFKVTELKVNEGVSDEDFN